jgi:4a-hydroxytetrahydrobiopterin dehydratase
MDLLTEEEISAQLAGLPDWDRQGDAIVHVQTLHDFSAAMLYAGAVAGFAEAANHHPDILIQWNKVTLTLATHSAGGLTAKDFALAGQISSLA